MRSFLGQVGVVAVIVLWPFMPRSARRWAYMNEAKRR